MFAIVGALIRFASASLSNEMIVFFRNIFALMFLFPFFVARNGLSGLKTQKLHLHLLRSAAGLAAMYCYFYALANMKLAEAVLLSYTSPLIIPLIAWIWLRESVPRMVRVSIFIGFIGVLFILKPGVGIFQPVSLIALTAAIFASLAMTTIRRMSVSEPPGRIVFYFALLTTTTSAVPLIWAWETPNSLTLFVLLLVGIIAIIAQFLMTKGYSTAPAAQVGPFIYATIVFATIIGWLFWGESLDILTWIGALLVCVAGIGAIRKVEEGKE